ncbi:hypothetical protein OROHE_004503 [Orobanche hederae]
MPLIVEALLDGASAMKREVAVTTLGQVVQSTGREQGRKEARGRERGMETDVLYKEDWDEYVDMYLVHWPVKLKPWACSAVPNEQDFDKLDIVGTWAGIEKCLQMGLCRAISVTESYSILLILLICVAQVVKSAFDKALAEHVDIDDDVGSEEPTKRDHGVDLQQPLLIKIDSSDSHKK